MDLELGDQLDRYRLEKLVARTGTASVFKAADVESEQVVALKIPHLDAESDVVFFERFQREAAIGRELDHPAITKVLPKHEQSRVYIAMEWLEGTTLRAELEREGKLPADRAVKIAIQLCEGLDYIHSKGVVHRDLKPENIFVGSDDSVKLVDFGIAAKRGSRRLTFGHLSRIMGTPDYISPEQVRGRRGDARTDIYALGIILFEMLTGETPFHGGNPLTVINDRLLNDPASLQAAGCDIDPALEAIIRRAMSREPKDRYRSAREVATHLEHPGPSYTASRQERPTTVTRRLMVCSGLAIIPMFIFLLLLYVARQQ